MYEINNVKERQWFDRVSENVKGAQCFCLKLLIVCWTSGGVEGWRSGGVEEGKRESHIFLPLSVLSFCHILLSDWNYLILQLNFLFSFFLNHAQRKKTFHLLLPASAFRHFRAVRWSRGNRRSLHSSHNNVTTTPSPPSLTTQFHYTNPISKSSETAQLPPIVSFSEKPMMQRNLLMEQQVCSDSVNKATSSWIAGFFCAARESIL